MSHSKEYIVKFSGLAVGEHVFELSIKDPFFEDLAYSEIKRGDIKVKLSLLKRSNMMVLTFEIGGTVKANCDRCAAEFDLPINGNYELIVKIGDYDVSGEDDDIISVGASESKIDLSSHLYEYIMISLPFKREHTKVEECDKKVLAKLNELLVEEDIKKPIDPRWDDLNKIELN